MMKSLVMLLAMTADRAALSPVALRAVTTRAWKMAACQHPAYVVVYVLGLARAVYAAGPTYPVGNGRRALAWLRSVPSDDPVARALLGKPHPRPGRNPVRYVTIPG